MISLLIVISILFTMLWYTIFYILSVGPAQLEKKIGGKAYKICALLRKLSFIGMGLCIVSEVLYFIFPFEQSIRLRIFDGVAGWIICICVGLILTICGTLIIIKVSKVAHDLFVPLTENEMFGGIYEKIRHPRAIADVAYWFAIAFLLNSFFLLLIAVLWIPLNLIIVLFEEKDLKIRFGSAYGDYMKRTNRFIPSLGNFNFSIRK